MLYFRSCVGSNMSLNVFGPASAGFLVVAGLCLQLSFELGRVSALASPDIYCNCPPIPDTSSALIVVSVSFTLTVLVALVWVCCVVKQLKTEPAAAQVTVVERAPVLPAKQAPLENLFPALRPHSGQSTPASSVSEGEAVWKPRRSRK